MPHAAEFKNVSYWYPNTKKPALKNLNLKVKEKEFLLVVGSSGSGKSTFCRCLNGLIPHFSGGTFKGKIVVDGLDTLKKPTHEIARHVGMVFQDPENQFVMTTTENEIAFGLENIALPQHEMRERINETLDKLNIRHLKEKRVDQLSGGEKQKVVIASILAMKPKILVLDEPTSQLDPQSAEELLSFIENLNKDVGITVVLAEHRIERVLEHSTRVLDLDRNVSGRPVEVLSSGRHRPPVLELSVRLREMGYDIPHPRSVDEARESIGRLNIAFKKTPTNPIKTKGKPIIAVENIAHSYGTQRALDNVNLTVSDGEFIALMGLNGSGKTTLVKHISGLIKPQTGSVTVSDRMTTELSIEELASYVGYLSQNPNEYLFSDTVEDELRFTLKNLGRQGDIEETLKLVGLSKHKNSYPRDLSGGERQRVALASILVGNPKVVIMDEPTRGMDYESKKKLVRFLAELKNRGKTIILVTHDVETVTEHVERVVLMEDGRIIADGPTRCILATHHAFKPQTQKIIPSQNFLTPKEVLRSLK